MKRYRFLFRKTQLILEPVLCNLDPYIVKQGMNDDREEYRIYS